MVKKYVSILSIILFAFCVSESVGREEVQLYRFDSSKYPIITDAIKLNVSISSKDKHMQGDPLCLCITAENISDATLRIDWWYNLYDQFSILATKNEMKVPYTEYGKAVIVKPTDSVLVSMGNMIDFTPGMKIKCQYVISRTFDMSLPGEYVFSATCSFLDYGGKKVCASESNRVTVNFSETPSSSFVIEHPNDSPLQVDNDVSDTHEMKKEIEPQ